MISIYVVCFVLSVYSKLFNIDSVWGHVAVKSIIDAGLFWEIQDGCQDDRHKIFYILVYNTPCLIACSDSSTNNQITWQQI